MAKKQMGRPKKQVEQRKSRYLQVRVEDAEKAAFDKAAGSNGLDTSAWVRLRLREAARNDLAKIGDVDPFMAGHPKGR